MAEPGFKYHSGWIQIFSSQQIHFISGKDTLYHLKCQNMNLVLTFIPWCCAECRFYLNEQYQNITMSLVNVHTQWVSEGQCEKYIF